jgi:hypothetical protein
MVWGGALCSAYVIGSVETTLCVLSVEEKTWGCHDEKASGHWLKRGSDSYTEEGRMGVQRKGVGWVEGNKSAAVAAAPRRGPAERERNGEATPPPAQRLGGWCGEAISLERSRAKRPPRKNGLRKICGFCKCCN